MKLKKLLNEIYGNQGWKQNVQQMKVHENPFHTAFTPIDETKEVGDKKLTKKVIHKLKELKGKYTSEEKKQKIQDLLEKLHIDYHNGKYLKEIKSLYEVMDESFYVRKDMPQVKTDDLGKAFNKLREMGIDVEEGKTTPDTFKPSQKDIYQSKVDAILKRTSKSNLRTMKPLVVSKDNYIVDGHHRWKALLDGFPKERIPYIKIDLPVKKAIQVYNKIASLI